MNYPKLRYFPLNWQDGLKLSASHFQHLENSIDDHIRDARAIAVSAGGSFGLLPGSSLLLKNERSALSGAMRVVLESCRAILPGGYRVEILPENIQSQEIPAHAPSVEFSAVAGVRYHIYLTINEQRRVPTGHAQTRPSRLPYLIPEYNLECFASDKLPKINGIVPNRMKIAEWQDGKLKEGYIPPCLTIFGHNGLMQWHQYLMNQLENIAVLCKQGIPLYRSKDYPRTQLFITLHQHIRSSQGYYSWQLPQESPINMAAYFADLIGVVQSLFETLDKDFVRNHLKDGNIHNIGSYGNEVMKLGGWVHYEDMALALALIRRYVEALINALKELISTPPFIPSTGDGNHPFRVG